MNSLSVEMQLLVGSFLGKNVLATLGCTNWYFNGLADQLSRKTYCQKTDGDGNVITLRWGVVHSWNGQPAIVHSNGSLSWWKNDRGHRDDDQPCLVRFNGVKVWKQNGKLHRDGDKPARITPFGPEGARIIRSEWFQNDLKHRDGDKPAEASTNGHTEWWKNGKLHRDGDKPAIIRKDGTTEWYCHGKKLTSPVDQFDGAQWWFATTITNR